MRQGRVTKKCPHAFTGNGRIPVTLEPPEMLIRRMQYSVTVRARLDDFRLGNEVSVCYSFFRLTRLAHVGEVVPSDR